MMIGGMVSDGVREGTKGLQSLGRSVAQRINDSWSLIVTVGCLAFGAVLSVGFGHLCVVWLFGE